MNGIKERTSNLSNRDQKFLERAFILAKLSDCKQRHGAIIVSGGRIIGSGINTFRNDPITNMSDDIYSCHAEVNALRSIKRFRQVGKVNADASETIPNSKIYVARVSRRGLAAFSRPCTNCYLNLLKAGIKEIIYTTD